MRAAVAAVVVAGGEGRRFGGPKQFALLWGRTVIEWSVEAAKSVADDVVLVLPQAQLFEISRHAGCSLVTAGGATRAASVRAGLALVSEDTEIVVVHDAARPLASAALFARVVAAVRDGAAGAIPGVPLSDTVKRVAGNLVLGTVDRSDLVAVQTPQAFRVDALRRAHDGAAEATDDAGLLEAIGEKVVVVEGETANVKLTDPGDLDRLAASPQPGAWP